MGLAWSDAAVLIALVSALSFVAHRCIEMFELYLLTEGEK